MDAPERTVAPTMDSIRTEAAPYQTARWIISDKDSELQKFISLNRSSMAEDKNGDPVFLVRNDWSLNRAG